MSKNIDSSILLANHAIELSEKLEYQKGLADGYFNVGNVWFLRDSLAPTISNYLKAYWTYAKTLSPPRNMLIYQTNQLCKYLYRPDGPG
ncbi:MAG: hypothetical protein R2750_03975 [Bacteroidales bacterium]